MSRSRGATSAVVLLLALACIASSAGTAQAGRFSETLEGARTRGRHLLQGWFGGPGTESIMSANDAVGAIESAVDNDNFASTYAATQEGYADANAAVYPDDTADAMWLNSAPYRTYPNGGPGYTSMAARVNAEVNGKKK